MRSANGMINQLALYQHILLGVKLEVWNCAYSTDRVENELFNVWLDNGLMDATGELSQLGEHFVRNREFMQYELNVAYDNSVQAHPKTKPENYVMLRDALGKTFLSSIRPMFVEAVMPIIADGVNVLDYAGGNGDYSITMLNCFTHSDCNINIRLMDKHPQCESKRITVVAGDLISDRNWMISYISHYDLVMANEIIHCLDDEELAIALHDMWYVLKDKGTLLIGEQMPSERMRVRMAAYTNGRMYKPKDMIKRVESLGEFKLVDIAENPAHYFLKFEVVR